MLTDPAEFEGLVRGLGEAVAGGLDECVMTGLEVVVPAAHPATRMATRTAVAVFTIGE